jgi:RNA-binding protein 5/10
LFRVCKRKFANIEKLKEHEKLSALHQQNLANQKRIEEAKNIEYRDRASERRSMYEADLNNAVAPIDPSIVNMGPSLDKARTVTTTEKVTPDQTLGESSVGNKLLQKLGWKSGESLGRNRGDESESTSKLKKDWEMIEHLSGSKS